MACDIIQYEVKGLFQFGFFLSRIHFITDMFYFNTTWNKEIKVGDQQCMEIYVHDFYLKRCPKTVFPRAVYLKIIWHMWVHAKSRRQCICWPLFRFQRTVGKCNTGERNWHCLFTCPHRTCVPMTRLLVHLTSSRLAITYPWQFNEPWERECDDRVRMLAK